MMRYDTRQICSWYLYEQCTVALRSPLVRGFGKFSAGSSPGLLKYGPTCFVEGGRHSPRTFRRRNDRQPLTPSRRDRAGLDVSALEDVLMRFHVGRIDDLGEILRRVDPDASFSCVLGICLSDRKPCEVQHDTHWTEHMFVSPRVFSSTVLRARAEAVEHQGPP